MAVIKILWGVKIGDPDYMEQIITEQPERIEAAKIWAANNGFNRFRIAEIKPEDKPDFINTINKN
jgi:hypothetical protein